MTKTSYNVHENALVIQLNGAAHNIPDGATLCQIVELFQLRKDAVVCELNRQVVDRKLYGQTKLKDHDQLEIVQFVGGG